MAEKSKIPAIRFAGFTEAWEQRKLGSLAIFNPKAELPNVFEYVDLESVVGTEMLSHRTESKRTAPSRAQRLAQTGDLFYQTVRPYQKNNFLFEKSDKYYVFSTGYAQMRPVVDGLFLLCIVQSNGFMKVVLDNCTGTSYPSIKSNDLAEIEVYSPINPKEQEYIGKLFKGIDNLITLHQRKYDKLVNVKKAMLEKMFPKDGADVPEIRFKGFTEAWEQRKFIDLFVEKREKTEYENEDTLLSCAINGIFLNSELFGHFRGSSTIGYLRVNKNDLILSAQNLHLGNANVNWRFEHGIISPAYKVYHLNCSNPRFVHTWVKMDDTKNFFLSATTEGASQCRKNIEWETLEKQTLLFPSLKEQDKIGKYFEYYDNLITLHQRKLEKLKNLKKACLEKMFV